MPIVISPDDPVAGVIRTETDAEIVRWSERLLRAGTGLRSYTEQKNIVRELFRWSEAEPETRREVLKSVVREVRHSMDIYVHLQVIACERRK